MLIASVEQRLFLTILLIGYITHHCQAIKEVYVAEGTETTLRCPLNNSLSTNSTASNGLWYKDELEMNQDGVMNDEGTSYRIIHAKYTDNGTYLYRIDGISVCNFIVIVGEIPPVVQNLACYSHHDKNNYCDWSLMPYEATNLPTSYSCTLQDGYRPSRLIQGMINNTTCSFGKTILIGDCNVTITSVNAFGSMSVSHIVDFKLIAIPFPPTGVKLIQQHSNDRLFVSWNYPVGFDDNSAHYLKYVIRYKNVNQSDWIEIIVDGVIKFAIPHKVSYYTKYEAQVKVMIYSNYSDWSDPAYCMTREARPESQKMVKANYTSQNTDKGRDITIRWEHMDEKDANGIILVYYLSLGDETHQVEQAVAVPAESTNYTFKDLEKDKIYYVNITAANSVGNSTVRMLFIDAEPYSYKMVIIVVIVALIIIIIAAAGFLSWNKLQKTSCLKPWPEPNFLDPTMYPFEIIGGQYEAVERHHEYFDNLKCEHPPEPEQDLIEFTFSDPIIQPKHVELPPTDSGVESTQTLQITPRKTNSHDPYASLSYKIVSLDTSGFNSKVSSLDHKALVSTPGVSSEGSSDNYDGYAKMNNVTQNSTGYTQDTGNSAACRSDVHDTSDDHINNYVKRTFVLGSPPTNQFGNNDPMNIPPPLPTPDIDGYVTSPSVKFEPSNNAGEKNIGDYVAHLQLQKMTRGASNSSPNLFSNPAINSLAEGYKGKSASAVHVDDQTDASAASSGYVLSSMMSTLSGGSSPGAGCSPRPPADSSAPKSPPTPSGCSPRPPADSSAPKSPPTPSGCSPRPPADSSAPKSPPTPSGGAPRSPADSGAPKSPPVAAISDQSSKGRHQDVVAGFPPISPTLTGDSLVSSSTRQPGRQSTRDSPNPRRHKEGCVQGSNKEKKLNGCACGNTSTTDHVAPNATAAGTSVRNTPPQSLPLRHAHTVAASQNTDSSEDGFNRQTQARPPTLLNQHTTADARDVVCLSPIENGYVPLSSFSSPE